MLREMLMAQGRNHLAETDGNGLFVARQAPNPEMRHDVAGLRSHTANTTDNSGTQRAGVAR